MTRVEFHEVKGKRWQLALCGLVEEAYQEGCRVYLRTASQAQAREFDELLWAFRDVSFVPHGLWQGEPYLEDPVAVGWKQGNPNRAQCLAVACDLPPEEAAGFSRVVDVAPADHPALLQAARNRYRSFRAAGFEVEFRPAGR